MKKWISLLLVSAMMLALTACSLNIGNKNETNPPADQQTAAPQPQEPDTPAVEPEIPAGTPEAPLPDSDVGEAEPAGADESGEAAQITASHTDVTLFSAGETFTLSARDVPGIYACSYLSADPAVAAVDELTGVVTAAAPGTTKITMHVECEAGQFDFACIVRCSWTEDGASEPVSGAISGQPSLNDFFTTLQGKYEGLGAMMVMDSGLLDNYYPDLSGIAAVEEVLVQETMISVANVAVGLVRLKDGASNADIAAVQNALQARMDAQAAGGAFYPESCETWENGVITSASNVVGMFVYPGEAQAMADLFAQTYGG